MNCRSTSSAHWRTASRRRSSSRRSPTSPSTPDGPRRTPPSRSPGAFSRSSSREKEITRGEIMEGAVLYGPHDVRFEQREETPEAGGCHGTLLAELSANLEPDREQSLRGALLDARSSLTHRARREQPSLTAGNECLRSGTVVTEEKCCRDATVAHHRARFQIDSGTGELRAQRPERPHWRERRRQEQLYQLLPHALRDDGR